MTPFTMMNVLSLTNHFKINWHVCFLILLRWWFFHSTVMRCTEFSRRI